MKRQNLSILIFAIILGCVAFFAYSQGQSAAFTRVLLENKGGTVVFEHSTHVDQYGLECETCHHTDADPKTGVEPCGACHNDARAEEEGGLNRKDAFHQMCITCHEETAGPGTDDCNACHYK